MTILNRFKNYLYLSNFKISDKRRRFFYILILILTILVGLKTAFYYDLEDYTNLEIFVNIGLFFFSLTLLSTFIRILIVSTYRKRNKLSIEYYDNFILGISGLINVIAFFIFFFGLLYIFDVKIKVFLTSLGLFSVALAWIFKEYIANLLDGIVIMFSNNIRLGDYVKINDFKGIVKHITFLNIELKTDEGDIVYIPNTTLFATEVINYSKVKYKRIILDFELEKNLSHLVEKLDEFMLDKLLDEYPEYIDEHRYFMKINEIKEKKILLAFEVSVKKYTFAFEDDLKKFISVNIIRFVNKNRNKIILD